MPTVPPSKFAHVVYRTRRFQEMLQWYGTVFGARVQYQDPALAFLTYDDEHHRFAFADMAVLQPNGSETERQGGIGVDHVAYTYSSVGDLLENYATLKDAGIEPYWCVHHDITISMYYADPDGNQMEFQVDCLAPGTNPGAFMAESFAKNPVGVEYDPDELLDRYRSGASAAELLRRESDQPMSPIRGEFQKILVST